MWVAIKDGAFLFGASFGGILLGGAADFIEKSDFLLYLHLGALKVDCHFFYIIFLFFSSSIRAEYSEKLINIPILAFT